MLVLNRQQFQKMSRDELIKFIDDAKGTKTLFTRETNETLVNACMNIQVSFVLDELNKYLSKSNYELKVKYRDLCCLHLLKTQANGYIDDTILSVNNLDTILSILLTINIMVWKKVNFEGLI